MTKPTVPARATVPGPTASVGNPSPKAAIRVLLIGKVDRPEMAWAFSSKNLGPAGAISECNKAIGEDGTDDGDGRRLASVCWQHAADFRAAIELIDAGTPIPDVVVLAYPYPGCFAQRDLEHFRRRYPLVRLACLAGSWCEGESRSGRPLSGVLRIPWHQWAMQQDRQLAALADSPPGPWALPPTATQDEHLLARAAYPQRRLCGAVGIASIEQARAAIADDQSEGRSQTVSPASADSSDLRWIATTAPPAPAQEACRVLHEACDARGVTGVFLRAERARAANSSLSDRYGKEPSSDLEANPPSPSPCPLRAVFAEVTSLDGQARSLVAHLASAVAPATLALLANFPRVDQAAAAVAVGAAAVLAKPFDLDDLFAWIERAGPVVPADH